MAHRCPCGSLILCSLKEGGWKLKSSEEGRCQFRKGGGGGAAKNRRGAQRHAMSLWMKPCIRYPNNVSRQIKTRQECSRFDPPVPDPQSSSWASKSTLF